MLDFPIYSPLEEVHSTLFQERQVRLFIKRDDLIHPFISGNKWRKLKYNLIKARQQNKTHLVTFGGVWSNHLLATASACAKFGFKSTAFVRGEDVNNELLFLCRMFGMELRFTDRESYRNKKQLFDTFFGSDSTSFFLDEGGAGAEATQGCAELIDELPENFQHIFCAAGTGTTAAGIINGLNNHKLATKMHVIPVLKGADYLKSEIQQLLGFPIEFEFHTAYHFGGYAKTQPELLRFVREFSTSTGILLDPIYTGKMMYAVFDMLKNGHFSPGDKILTIHTGGLFGLLGMKEKFGRLSL